MKNYIAWLGILPAFVFTLNIAGAQSVQIKSNQVIQQMETRFVERNKSQPLTEGWRVQILATTDRQNMENVRQQFQYQYPNVLIDWVHSKPYYKLRAGAFQSKLEAMRLKYILEEDFEGLYLVRDDAINRRDLLNSF
jgi:hypothetical protein